MSSEGDKLTVKEKAICDAFAQRLGKHATVVRIEDNDGEASIHVVSPTEFLRVASLLEEFAGSVARDEGITLNVTLTTSWRPK
jgi:hypothetical protein